MEFYHFYITRARKRPFITVSFYIGILSNNYHKNIWVFDIRNFFEIIKP